MSHQLFTSRRSPRAILTAVAGGGRFHSILVALAVAVVVTLAVSGLVLARDELIGDDRGNVLVGTPGQDRIAGGAGNDRISGRGGDDVLAGGDGYDRLRGGSGDDVIRARDGADDKLDCGPGRDIAVVDRAEDGVYDCERLRIPTPAD